MTNKILKNKPAIATIIYLVCSGLGILNLCKTVSKYIFLNYLQNEALKTSLNEWVKFWWFPIKKYEFLYFSMALLCFSIFTALIFWLLNRHREWVFGKFKALLDYRFFSYFYFFLLFAFTANNPTRMLAMAMIKSDPGSALIPTYDFLFMAGILIVPVFSTNRKLINFLASIVQNGIVPLIKAWPRTLFALGIINLFFIFGDLIVNKISLINDNMSLSAFTSLKSFNESEISTLKRLNIYGFSDDPETLPLTHPNNFSIPISNLAVWDTLQKKQPDIAPKFIIDPYEKLLVPTCHLDVADASTLSSLMNSSEKLQFDSVQQRLSLRDWSRIRPIDPLGLNPTLANELLTFKIYNRWLLHHHNFTLGSMSEFLLGRPLNEINIQYGLGFTIATAKILEFFNKLSLHGYFDVWFTGYILYFLLFLIIAHKVFGDLRFTAAVCAVSVMGLNNLLYDGFLRHPGFTPMRHFWDLPFILGGYLFFKTQKNKWLVLACAAIILQLFWSADFGVPMACSIIASVFFANVSKALPLTKTRSLIYFIFIVGVFVALKSPALYSKSYLAEYYLQGLAGNELPKYAIQAIIFVCFSAILTTLFVPALSMESRFSTLLFLFYVGCSFIYYVWGATEPHLWNLTPIIGFAAVSLFRIISKYDFEYQKIRVISLLATVAVIGFYLHSIGTYTSSKTKYEYYLSAYNNVSNWNLPRADIKSVVDSKPITDSIALINKYIPNEQKGIYLISKLDNFIPFLAGKFSALPFPDLQWFLMSSKEDRIVLDKIDQKKPEYLFIENELDSTLLGQIITRDNCTSDPFHLESVNRVLRHLAMRRLYHELKLSYTKIEASTILSVYRRNQR